MENRGPIRFQACKWAKPYLVKEGAGDAVLHLNGRQKSPGAAPRCEMASKRQELRSHAKASVRDPDIEGCDPAPLWSSLNVQASHTDSGELGHEVETLVPLQQLRDTAAADPVVSEPPSSLWDSNIRGKAVRQ